jgi:hypothetical protein
MKRTIQRELSVLTSIRDSLSFFLVSEAPAVNIFYLHFPAVLTLPHHSKVLRGNNARFECEVRPLLFYSVARET